MLRRGFARKSGLLLLAALLLLRTEVSSAFQAKEDANGVTTARTVTLHPAKKEPRAYCAVLDADVYANAQPGLRDLRLLRAGHELPFVLMVSAPSGTTTDEARVLNARDANGEVYFDLEMPERAYTRIQLHLDAQDFLASAEVTAGDIPSAASGRRAGSFLLFDLTRQGLSRETSIPLQEMHDRYLHIALRVKEGTLHAAQVKGASVPPSRSEQSFYTTVATATRFVQEQGRTIAEFDLPAHTPVERVTFRTAAGNFMRKVHLAAWPKDDPADVERAEGTISSVHTMRVGLGLVDVQRDVQMTVGANLHGPAHMRVTVENGDGPALALESIQLQMRQHRLCFNAAERDELTLVTGGTAMADDADGTLMQPQLGWDDAGEALLGPSQFSTPALRQTRQSLPWYRRVPVLGAGFVLVCGALLILLRRRF